jgi:hypothetical protein
MNIIGGDLRLKGDLIYSNGHSIRYRKINDDEIKILFQNIKLNTGFSLPEAMVQDFIQDGSIDPTFKKCIHFNKKDLHTMVQPLIKHKKHRKIIPKLKTKRKRVKNTRVKKTKVKKTYIKK